MPEIRALPRAGSFARSVARIGLFNCCGIDCCLHGVCLAHSPRIADQSGNLCVCESGSRRSRGIFPGRRGDRPAHHRGDAAGAGECGRDRNDAEKEDGTRTFGRRSKLILFLITNGRCELAPNLSEGVIPKSRVFTSGARDLARITGRRRLIDFAPSLRQVVPMGVHRLD